MIIRRIKKRRMISLIVTGAVTAVLIYIAFSVNFDRVYALLLEKDIAQTTFTSNFVTKLIESEIQNIVSDLKASQKVLLQVPHDDVEQLTENLRDFCEERGFEKVGVSDLRGNAVDSAGNRSKLGQTVVVAVADNRQEYISNVIDEADTILLAVPIMNGSTPAGILWGHYQVEQIARKIELDYDSHRYFQIVDNSGNYISDSNNIHSFAKDANIWEEIKRYQISDGITVEDIRQDVENGGSGRFHFTYDGAGRYVSYEPLGINNWYVFSVFIEEDLTEYVSEIEKIFTTLLWGVLTCVIVVIAFIGKNIYRTTMLMRDQNKKLASRNSLLSMVLQHTNDIPFEINLKDRTITVYKSGSEEQAERNSLEEFLPEKMLKREWISEDYLENYKAVYDNMLQLKEMEPAVIKMKIDGEWDYNKVYYEVVNPNQIVGVLEDYNEQILQHEQMEKINRRSRLDALTSLYNRNYFKHRVEQEMKRARMSDNESYSALFMLDLDFFKQANDTLGHMMGDEILKESARILKSSVRSTDICGRLGGDEFVLFLQNIRDMDSIRVCAEKMNRALHRTYGKDGKSVTVCASIGIVVVTTETTFDELYQLADTALYKVKENGKNGFWIMSKEIKEHKEAGL